MCDQKQIRVGDLCVACDSLPSWQFFLQRAIFAKVVFWMALKTFQLFKSIGNADLTMHNFRVQGKADETALGHVAGGKKFIGEPPKPSLSAGVMLVVIPRERNQDVDIQQIHTSFLGQGVRDLFGRNLFARVMHQDAVFAVSLGCHRGKLRLRLAILRDGELLAARDLFEQIRERGLGFFQCDRLHNAKTLTRLPAQGQYFCVAGWRAHTRGQPPPRRREQSI